MGVHGFLYAAAKKDPVKRASVNVAAGNAPYVNPITRIVNSTGTAVYATLNLFNGTAGEETVNLQKLEKVKDASAALTTNFPPSRLPSTAAPVVDDDGGRRLLVLMVVVLLLLVVLLVLLAVLLVVLLVVVVLLLLIPFLLLLFYSRTCGRRPPGSAPPTRYIRIPAVDSLSKSLL